MSIDSELNKLRSVIKQFEGIDIGYPKDNHCIEGKKSELVVTRIANVFRLSPSSELIEFYQCCDGIELPDVGNGYLIYSAEDLISINSMDSEPRRLGLNDILVIGGDGGGGRFAYLMDTGQIFYLPMAAVLNGEYLGGEAKVLATNIEGLVRHFADQCLIAAKRF
jgi:hypothetical protein